MTLLFGTDHAGLLLHRDFRQGQNGEPTVVKTALGWVLMGGSKTKEKKNLCNYIPKSLIEKMQNFWKLESYRTPSKMSSKLLPTNEKRSLEGIPKTTIIKDNCIETGLLWKKEKPVLPHNRALALNQYQYLVKKFLKKKTLFSSIAKKLMNIYCLGMHAS